MADGRVIDGLPVTAFDWGNMVDDYTQRTTEAQEAFVFVNPSYGPSTFTIALAERNDDGTPDLSRISASMEHEFTGYRFADLDGRHLPGKPTAKGVYVVRPAKGCLQGRNGRKAVVR